MTTTVDAPVRHVVEPDDQAEQVPAVIDTATGEVVARYTAGAVGLRWARASQLACQLDQAATRGPADHRAALLGLIRRGIDH